MTLLRFLKTKTNVKISFFTQLSLLFVTFHVKKKVNSSFQFLDVLVKKHKTGFITSMYRKPTFTRQYLHWDSFSLMKQKINHVASLVHRALFICFSSRLQAELDKILSILVANGYPNHIIAFPFTKKIRLFNQSSQLDPRNTPFISIFYGWEIFQQLGKI